ncbi:hypothetical protein LA345_12825 [Burkholderia vietnamiensis]|nr:hypothetical protein [Burkholderia vietnamiensis]
MFASLFFAMIAPHGSVSQIVWFVLCGFCGVAWISISMKIVGRTRGHRNWEAR